MKTVAIHELVVLSGRSEYDITAIAHECGAVRCNQSLFCSDAQYAAILNRLQQQRQATKKISSRGLPRGTRMHRND